MFAGRGAGMRVVAYLAGVVLLLIAVLLAMLQSSVFTGVAASDQHCTTSITAESVSDHEPGPLASTPLIKVFKWWCKRCNEGIKRSSFGL